MQPVISGTAGAASRRGSRFFTASALAMLLVVLVGFAPTFFLRPFFDVPAVPGYVLVHGVIMTAWFVWFLLQSVLVRTNRISLHRRLGIVGMWLASVVVAMGLFITVDLAVVELFWLNLFLLLDFSVCTLAAFAWRTMPDVHKRLTLFASISLIGPASGRIAAWSIFADFAGLINAMPALFLVATVVHDFVERRRLHIVTASGGALLLGSLALAAFVGNSDFGRSFALGLR